MAEEIVRLNKPDEYSGMSDIEYCNHVNKHNVFNIEPEALDPRCPFVYIPQRQTHIDEWIPEPWDIIFKTCNKAIIVPVSNYYNTDIETINYFNMSPKRCYNNPKNRDHFCKYLNYFTRFYDQEKELLAIYCNMKVVMDCNVKTYQLDDCIGDLKRYIICNPSIQYKAKRLVYDNQLIELRPKSGKFVDSLQYRTTHGIIIMWMSLLMDMVIPIISHFLYNNKSKYEVDDTLLEVYDIILNLTYADIYSKLEETSHNIIGKSVKRDKQIWAMQDIRGINMNTHCETGVENVLLNIMPKYDFTKNAISLNYVAYRSHIKYKVSKVEYEYDYSALSSSRRDEDMNSDFDKYESYQIKQNEALSIQNQINCDQVMSIIKSKYYFDESEIQYYYSRLKKDNVSIINSFQERVLFSACYKFFGDTTSIMSISKTDYICLMIYIKNILLSNNQKLMPYVISSRIIKNPSRKSLTKSETFELESLPVWKLIHEKYMDERTEMIAKEMIAMIISADYEIIEPDDEEIDGKIMNTKTLKSYLMKEAAEFILLQI